MVRKGVSAEEKRKRALEYMLTTKEVFRLKDLESKLSKECGIVSQSVKDVVQGLVDDELIDSDKIGTSSFGFTPTRFIYLFFFLCFRVPSRCERCI